MHRPTSSVCADDLYGPCYDVGHTHTQTEILQLGTFMFDCQQPTLKQFRLKLEIGFLINEDTQIPCNCLQI